MDKEQTAIERLKTASEMSLAYYEQPLIICHSGGKDSVVLAELAIRAEIPIETINNHTTADAPETVYFIRDEFKRLEEKGINCKIVYPMYKGKRTSMWDLIVINQMPPLKQVRYCCKILKENGNVTKNRMIATGVRWDESTTRRNNRGIYEKLGNNSKEKIILANDNDDRRQLFENCSIKAKRVVNPIVDWSNGDIWGYIHSENLPVNPLYSCGFSRVGCVGCPMAGKKRYTEFARYPKYKEMYLRAFGHMIEARKAAGKSCKGWETPRKVFDWWMEDENADGQTDLFGSIKGEEE